jgi:ubiquinone/menaquinone biosynthesis C-methylase UbiE
VKISSQVSEDGTSKNALHKLETTYAHFYDEMYPEFLKWMKLENEALLRRMKGKSLSNRILELGAGTARQSWLLSREGVEPYALDLSHEMVELGSKRIGDRIQVGDARSFESTEPFGAIVMGPLVATFLTENSDVHNALLSANRALEKGGLLLGDFTPARNIFADPSYNNGIRKYEFKVRNGRITRFGEYSLIVNQNVKWEWRSTYIFELDGKVGTDTDRTVLRAFWPSEVEMFLELAGFRIIETLGYDGNELGTLKDNNQNLSFVILAEKM